MEVVVRRGEAFYCYIRKGAIAEVVKVVRSLRERMVARGGDEFHRLIFKGVLGAFHRLRRVP
jgi:hypothetical protein